MLSFRRCVLLCMAAILVPACYPVGSVHDSNEPGSAQTIVEGRVAVDPVTETMYVVRSVDGGLPSSWIPERPLTIGCVGDGGVTPMTSNDWYSQLLAIDPDTGAKQIITSFAWSPNAQVVFPPAGILLSLGEVGSPGELRLFDRATRTIIGRQAIPSGFVRSLFLSPSGRFVAIASGDFSSPATVLLAETNLRVLSEAPCDALSGSLQTLGWLHSADDRLAVATRMDSVAGMPQHLRVAIYSTSALIASNFAIDSDGSWTSSLASFDVPVPEVMPGTTPPPSNDRFWEPAAPLAISADDRFAAIPVAWGVALVDLSSGTSTFFPSVVAPPSFTPDGSALIIEVANANAHSRLDFVDLASGATTSVDVPTYGGFAYFVTREGNQVLVTAAEDTTQWRSTVRFLAIDRTTHQASMPTAGSRTTPYLDQFVSRLGHDEVWILGTEGGVDRFDLVTGSLSHFPLDGNPSGIGILPSRDRLVFDDGTHSRLTIWDPTTFGVVSQTEYAAPP